MEHNSMDYKYSINRNTIRAILPTFFGTLFLLLRNQGLMSQRIYEDATAQDYFARDPVNTLITSLIYGFLTFVVILAFNVFADYVMSKMNLYQRNKQLA
jgi:ABC-type maltose transport system permease subunit